MSQAPMNATTTVPTLPPAMWALIAKPRRCGGNCSASDPRHHVHEGERRERRHQCLRREAPAEQDAAGTQKAAPRHDPRQLRIRELDGAAGERSQRREQRDRADLDAPLLDQPQVDERQEDRLGVVDRVRDREQPEGPLGIHGGRLRDGAGHRRGGGSRHRPTS
jgi:hypothetical protein